MVKHRFIISDEGILYNDVLLQGDLKFSFSSSDNYITICNAQDSRDVLLRGAKVTEIEVDGVVYNSLAELSKALPLTLGYDREFSNEFN